MREMEATRGERAWKPRWAVCIGLAILLILTLPFGFAVWIRSQPPEPSFGGRRLTNGWWILITHTGHQPEYTLARAHGHHGRGWPDELRSGTDEGAHKP